MFWNLWAFCHHLTLLTEWSVGRSFEKNAAAWNPTGARDQNRKWWESTGHRWQQQQGNMFAPIICVLLWSYMHENSFSVIISREIQRRGKLLGRQRKLKKLLPGNIFRSQKVQLHVTSSPPLHLLAMWTSNVCVGFNTCWQQVCGSPAPMVSV